MTPRRFIQSPPAQVKAVGDCATGNACRDSIDIVAMGVSGFLFVPWRDSTQLVMTPPSYTNPTLWWMVFGNWLFGSSPNTARIARRLRDLPAAGPDRLARVRGVLTPGLRRYRGRRNRRASGAIVADQ